MFWNMQAPSLNPIKGAVSKLEVLSSSISTDFCNAKSVGYSNRTVHHEINKIKEQTLLRLKIKGNLEWEGQLQCLLAIVSYHPELKPGRQSKGTGGAGGGGGVEGDGRGKRGQEG